MTSPNKDQGIETIIKRQVINIEIQIIILERANNLLDKMIETLNIRNLIQFTETIISHRLRVANLERWTVLAKEVTRDDMMSY